MIDFTTLFSLVLIVILAIVIYFDLSKDKKGCNGNCQQGRRQCDCGRQ